MRKAFMLAIAFAGLIALGGCAVTPSVSVHSLSSATPQIITTDSSALAIIMVRKADGGTGFCAEPSPDTAMTAVAKLIAEVNLQNPNIDAKTQIEFQTAVIELLSGEQVMKQQELAIQAALKMAEAELANNQSELAKSLRDPAVRGLWKQLVAPK